jgi:hypothetical protein
LLLKKTLPIVFVPHAFRLAPVAGHAELNASFSSAQNFFVAVFFWYQPMNFAGCSRLCDQ